MANKSILTVMAVSGLIALGLGVGAYHYLQKDSAPVSHEAPIKQLETQKTFNAQRFVLENGLEIIVIPSARVPAVTHMVWYRVGAADEPRGKSGIAHFLEHLMFKGSTGLQPGEFSEIVRSLGGNDNAFTSQDYTAYFQSIASEHLETVMRMEAGRMRGLAPPASEVESEREVILEERRQRIDNDPRAKFREHLSTAAFINHPYGTPIIGWAHEMETLSWDDAKSFYDQWYGPNNAILIVSGDVDAQQVYTLAQDIYGPIEPIDLPQRNWPETPDLIADAVVTFKDKSIRQPSVQSIYRAPAYRKNKNDALALEVLTEIMGGGSTSRLYKSIVIDQKLTSGAGLSYRPEKWDISNISIYASPLPGINVERVRAAYEDELRKLVKDGVTKDELEDAKNRMQDAAIYARDSLTGPAMVFGYALINGYEIDDVEYWPHMISAVSAEDIQRVAKAYLDPDAALNPPPVTGYLVGEELPMPEPVEIESVPAVAPNAESNAGGAP